MSRVRLIPVLALIGATLAVPAAAQARLDGPLAYVRDGKLTLVGPGGPQTRDVASEVGTDPHIAVSRDGETIAVALQVGDGTILRLVPVGGGVEKRVDLKDLSVNSVGFSPDGKTLALTAFRAGDDIAGHIYPYLYKLGSKKPKALKTAVRYAFDLQFAPDGKSLVYIGDRLKAVESSDCRQALRRVRPDGTRDTLLYQGREGSRPCPLQFTFSPGGTSVAMTAITAGDEPAGPGPASGVYTLALRKGAKAKRLAVAARDAIWSPSGAQIAYSGFGRTDGMYPYVGESGLFTVPKAGGPATKFQDQPVVALGWLSGGGA